MKSARNERGRRKWAAIQAKHLVSRQERDLLAVNNPPIIKLNQRFAEPFGLRLKPWNV